MNRHLVSVWVMSVAAVFGVAILLANDQQDPSYEVVRVKKKLVREEPAPEERLDAGAQPVAGSLLRTGSGASADIVSPDNGALFRLGSKTRVQLSSEVPGVLLVLEKGRLRAAFEKLTGQDRAERLVATPSAVLAVRGTEYGLEVDGKGNTTVTVFEGEVEVRHALGLGEPVRVRAGQYSRIRRQKPPQAPKQHSLSPVDWERGGRPDQPGTGPGSDGTMGGVGTGQSGGSAPGTGGGSPSGPGGGGSRGGGRA